MILERLHTSPELKIMIIGRMKHVDRALKISQDFFLLSLNIMQVKEIKKLLQFLVHLKVHNIILIKKTAKSRKSGKTAID
jgi:hypothetical protein